MRYFSTSMANHPSVVRWYSTAMTQQQPSRKVFPRLRRELHMVDYNLQDSCHPRLTQRNSFIILCKQLCSDDFCALKSGAYSICIFSASGCRERLKISLFSEIIVGSDLSSPPTSQRRYMVVVAQSLRCV